MVLIMPKLNTEITSSVAVSKDTRHKLNIMKIFQGGDIKNDQVIHI